MRDSALNKVEDEHELPTGCPLISTYPLWLMWTHTALYTYTQEQNPFKDNNVEKLEAKHMAMCMLYNYQ